MPTIEDDINQYVPSEYRHFFEGNQTVMNPSIQNRFEYFEWSSDTTCGLLCRQAMLQCAIMCMTFDPSTHLKIWKVCADQCLCVCQA